MQAESNGTLATKRELDVLLMELRPVDFLVNSRDSFLLAGTSVCDA